MGRRVEHRAVVVHRYLLNLQPQIVDDALDLGTPGTNVLGRDLQSGDAGFTLVVHWVGGMDELEVVEAHGDVRLQSVETAYDILGWWGGVRGLQLVEVGVHGSGASGAIGLEVGEAPLLALLMGIEATGELQLRLLDLVQDKLDVGIHDS
jgi:hypothetical protein